MPTETNAAVKLCCATCGQMNRVPADRLAQAPKCGHCGDPLDDGRVFELDAKSHDKAIRGDDLPLLVDYWAAWCGPCRMFAPIFEAAAQEHPDVVFAKLDTEGQPQIAGALGIQAIPTLMAFRGGVLVYREAGAMNASGFGQLVEAVRALDVADVRRQAALAADSGADTPGAS